KYCFRNSIQGIRFKGLERWQEAIITAVFWSSLARYYYFVTAGSWGLWHDEIHLENVEEMPIQFPADVGLRDRIVGVVEELQELDLNPQGLALGGMAARQRLPALERELNDAIFDLYQLNAAQRDLVLEMCTLGLGLFYRNRKSEAVGEVTRPSRSTGVLADVSKAKTGLPAYLRVFLEIWKRELGVDGEFVWQVLSPPSRAPLLAVSFAVQDKEALMPDGGDPNSWHKVLGKLAQSYRIPAGGSRIFIDTFFRYVGEREILFVKRNEQRFWTRTAAREDVESALTYLMNQGPVVLGGERGTRELCRR